MKEARAIPWWSVLKQFAGVPIGIGVAFMAAGLFFALVFSLLSDRSAGLYSDNDPAVAGTVTRVVASGTRQRTGSYRYDYQYKVGERTYEGTSFSPELVDGDKVRVRYLPDQPERSRIDGMAAAPLSSWVPLVGVGIMLLGVGIAGFGIWIVSHKIALLRYGIVTDAVVVRKEMPGFGRKGRPRYAVSLRFATDDGKTWDMVPDVNVGNFRDGQNKTVVYHANNPANSILLERLPAEMRSLI